MWFRGTARDQDEGRSDEPDAIHASPDHWPNTQQNPEDAAGRGPTPTELDVANSTERRSSSRIPTWQPAELLLTDDVSRGVTAVPVVVADISEGGVQLVVPQAPVRTSTLSLRLRLPPDDHDFEVALFLRSVEPSEHGGFVLHCRFQGLRAGEKFKILRSLDALRESGFESSPISSLERPLELEEADATARSNAEIGSTDLPSDAASVRQRLAADSRVMVEAGRGGRSEEVPAVESHDPRTLEPDTPTESPVAAAEDLSSVDADRAGADENSTYNPEGSPSHGASVPALAAYQAALEQARADEAECDVRIAELQQEIDTLSAHRHEAAEIATAIQTYIDRTATVRP